MNITQDKVERAAKALNVADRGHDDQWELYKGGVELVARILMEGQEVEELEQRTPPPPSSHLRGEE